MARPREPPLRLAILSNSESDAKRILDEDPSLASLPFFEHKWEPPLCFAARLNCKQAIFSLLLQCGAQWTDTDSYGRTAEELLGKVQVPPRTFNDHIPGVWEASVPWPSLPLNNPIRW
eukprot:TRINITY_DN57684_c0_g1_i1.p1 TRINITY_DN57684_c0_g1~~TRINITY_DN57684_c0_g1_i1.p1  ORF type:complete len:131 (+),score=12.66 TRINITY_DN57684_c0_g1_i1:40-393(+)